MMAVEPRIYLDHNATSPLLPQARAALVDALDLIGNPSSVHGEGRKARAVVEKARRSVAGLVSGDPENVVFTASATEAAATCLAPIWYRDGVERPVSALAVLDADHPATREGGRFDPQAVTRLGVDANGVLRFGELTDWLDRHSGATVMLAIGHANGETGVVQPISKITEQLRGRDVVFVLDAAQTAGRLPLDIATLGADALLLSGHKLGGAKGAGALVMRDEALRPHRLIPGGGQEKGLRSGTEALAVIASFGAAAETGLGRAGSRDAEWTAFRDHLVNGLRAKGIGFTVLGEGVERLANTLSMAFPDRKAESVQIALDLHGFAVSSGSACSSGKVGTSHALSAMARHGAPVDPSNGLLRISFGIDTTLREVEALAAALERILHRAGALGRDPIAA